jgi:ABC-2 type transport system permease protein
MTTAATTLNPFAAHTKSGMAAIYWKEAKYEFRKYLRMPMYLVVTIMFPVMFYVLFALVMNRQSRIAAIGIGTYLIAAYGAFGVMGASLVANGPGVAADRGLGWLQLKRASPMPPLAYFAAKFAVSMMFSTITTLLLLALGVLFGGVHIAAVKALELVLILAAGSIPFSALGLLIGCFTGPNSAAAAAVQLVYLPMSFASGLFFPLESMPKVMQKLSVCLPARHLLQLALRVVGARNSGPPWFHWLVLAGFAAVCLRAASWGFQRDESKNYG